MKILITGANGLLGQKLIKLLSQKEQVRVVATSRGENVNLLSASGNTIFRPMDIVDEKAVHEVMHTVKPDVIIHTAAMTNVDQCEQEREKCWDVNVNAVGYLLKASQEMNAFMVHLSTDFIFSGEYGPLAEEEPAQPVNYYGKSKAEAEKRVLNSGLHFAIVRTALVYGITPQMSRSNIVLWVKKSLEEGKSIKVVDDQFRTPTLAEDLAQGCWLIADKRSEGIFHISDEQLYTPYEMAIQVARHFGLNESLISRADSTSFTQPARRPPRTGFIIDKAKQQLGFRPHSFQEGIALMGDQIRSLP